MLNMFYWAAVFTRCVFLKSCRFLVFQSLPAVFPLLVVLNWTRKFQNFLSLLVLRTFVSVDLFAHISFSALAEIQFLNKTTGSSDQDVETGSVLIIGPDPLCFFSNSSVQLVNKLVCLLFFRLILTIQPVLP